MKHFRREEWLGRKGHGDDATGDPGFFQINAQFFIYAIFEKPLQDPAWTKSKGSLLGGSCYIFYFLFLIYLSYMYVCLCV